MVLLNGPSIRFEIVAIGFCHSLQIFSKPLCEQDLRTSMTIYSGLFNRPWIDLVAWVLPLLLVSNCLTRMRAFLERQTEDITAERLPVALSGLTPVEFTGT
jgi:hypothetical protein